MGANVLTKMSYLFVVTYEHLHMMTCRTLNMSYFLTALSVTTYLENLQLESTSATTIDLELAIEGYDEEIKRLKTMTAKSSSAYGYHTEEDIRNNITIIADVVSKDPHSVNNHRFACIASLKEIYAGRKWFSCKCYTCNIGLRPEAKGIICMHCGIVQNEKIAYCVNGALFDGTATMPIVIFNEAMTQLLGVDCEKLVIDEGYSDPTVLPPQLKSLIELNVVNATPSTTKVSTTAPATPTGKTPRRQNHAGTALYGFQENVSGFPTETAQQAAKPLLIAASRKTLAAKPTRTRTQDSPDTTPSKKCKEKHE